MKTKNLIGILLLILCTISVVSCLKKELDFEPEETEQSTIVEGTVITSGGLPIDGVKVKLDYREDMWLAYNKIRRKAETTTDKNGKYRLFFSIRDSEQETERDKVSGITKAYLLNFDMKHLDSKEYIMPSDMEKHIISINPPIAKLPDDITTDIEFYHTSSSFESAKTYMQNLYIPKKRYIQVTLTGFIPQQEDYFDVRSEFPYGGEFYANRYFPNTNYGYGIVGDYLFVLHDAQERTYQVPFALNENNIITIIRKKDGVSSREEHQLFVTKDTPESLTFEY